MLLGAWREKDYDPIVLNNQGMSTAQIGNVLVPSHPLFEGVKLSELVSPYAILHSISQHSHSVLTRCVQLGPPHLKATVLANYEDGNVFAAELHVNSNERGKKEGLVLSINVYATPPMPPWHGPSWSLEHDDPNGFRRLLSNACKYALCWNG